MPAQVAEQERGGRPARSALGRCLRASRATRRARMRACRLVIARFFAASRSSCCQLSPSRSPSESWVAITTHPRSSGTVRAVKFVVAMSSSVAIVLVWRWHFARRRGEPEVELSVCAAQAVQTLSRYELVDIGLAIGASFINDATWAAVKDCVHSNIPFHSFFIIWSVANHISLVTCVTRVTAETNLNNNRETRGFVDHAPRPAIVALSGAGDSRRVSSSYRDWYEQ